MEPFSEDQTQQGKKKIKKTLHMLSGFERLQLLADKEINFVSIKNSMLSMSGGEFAAVPTNMQAKRAGERRTHERDWGSGRRPHLITDVTNKTPGS